MRNKFAHENVLVSARYFVKEITDCETIGLYSKEDINNFLDSKKIKYSCYELKDIGIALMECNTIYLVDTFPEDTLKQVIVVYGFN